MAVNMQAWWNGLGVVLALALLGIGLGGLVLVMFRKWAPKSANTAVAVWVLSYLIIVIGLLSGGLRIGG